MERQSYKTHTTSNILYLLLSFPLGVFYFVLLITGLSAGIGTMIVWLGIPILFATIACIWGLAAIERSLATHLLHIDMPNPPATYAASGKIMEKFGLKMRDSLTWKSLAYLLIKFPLATAFFCITVTLVALCAGLFLAPLGYLIATYVLQVQGIHLAHTTAPLWWLNTLNMQITGEYEPLEFLKAFVCTIIGIALWIPVRGLLNGMARLSGTLAHVMLTSSKHYTTLKEEHYYSQPLMNPNL